MEIPACLFLGVWANLGVLSLYLGFEALNSTDLLAALPPAALFLFKHFLTISVSHSSTYTLLFRTKLKIHVLNYYALFLFTFSPIAFGNIAGDAFAWSLKIYGFANAFVVLYYFLPWKKRVLGEEFFNRESVAISLFSLLLALLPSDSDDAFLYWCFLSVSKFMIILQPPYTELDLEEGCLQLHLIAMYTLLMLGPLTKNFSPILVLFTPVFTCIAQAAVSGNVRFRRWLPAAALEQNRIFSELKKFMERNGKVVEFAAGMAATILFQYLYGLTSFDHVVACLFLAVVWLANLTVLLCHCDVGVFNFFLSNVIVGCTVSEFGVGTWLAYAAALLLYILRVKLDLICVVTRDGKEALIAWRQNQTVRIYINIVRINVLH